MSNSLSIDPVIVRTHELVAKHIPNSDATLWLSPPACLGAPLREGWRLWQPHFSDFLPLRAAGWQELDPQSQTKWERIVLYASKFKEENWDLLKAANGLLQEGGSILFAVPNEYGSKSYQAGLTETGQLIDYESGRKSRLYRLRRIEADSDQPGLVALRHNADGYWSCPGLFSWNTVDRGSALLAQALQGEDLKGPVADLGAGWGYLAAHLNPSLRAHLFESDQRGLEAALRNLDGRKVKTHWCDLSDTDRWPEEAPTAFGTVITNPPFHAGKKEEAALGQLFARLAHRLLPRGGALWLVGNTHLAYPKILGSLFSSVEVRAQKEGFQVVKASK